MPPNFISFCLVNQNVEETQTPSNLAPEIPIESSQPQVPLTSIHPDTSAEQNSGQPNLARLVASTGNNDSQTDVNALTEAMVQRLESLQTPEPREVSVQTSAGIDETQESRDKIESTPLSSPNLASTPFQSGEGVSLNSSLTQLESTLRVATTSRTQLPELFSAPDLSQEHSDPTNPQSNEDNDSSIHEVPALPGGKTRVRFLADLSEAEKTV